MSADGKPAGRHPGHPASEPAGDARENAAGSPAASPGGGTEQPDALELLAVAREVLVEAVLPELSGATRYQALMIANAMAIASRELTCRGDTGAGELEMLDTLYGDTEPRSEGEDDAARLARLTRRLARDLRNGELDGGLQLGVRRLLRDRLEARLAVSNPRRLGDKPAQ